MAKPVTLCQWFVKCDNAATSTEPHPILKDVPICGRCANKLAYLKGQTRG